MPKFTFCGDAGSHLPTVEVVVDGVSVRGLVPVPGEVYELAGDAPGPDWLPVKAEKKAVTPAE